MIVEKPQSFVVSAETGTMKSPVVLAEISSAVKPGVIFHYFADDVC